ncbi:hypothetical protein CAP36_11385 [Chitinophagaceae bacterium IBVUCB2]|nr:hypothetical protein CAP36_11385 [Chitinophagaceae bacterium IBVUCB2]
MTYAEFKNLSKIEKELIVWCRGVIIAQRENKQYSSVLFQVDGFYAEITYHHQCKFIRELFCFDSLEFLQPYLSSINIEAVYDY